MKRILFLLLISVVVWSSCKKTPNSYPIEPQIYYKSITPTSVDVRDTGSNIQVTFIFTDGDGDLGLDPTNMTNNIYMKDSRDTTAADSSFVQPFPYISPGMRPDNGSLEGNVVLTLKTGVYASLYADSLHIALGGDTLTYNIYIKDAAGHKSNVITTDPVYIKY